MSQDKELREIIKIIVEHPTYYPNNIRKLAQAILDTGYIKKEVLIEQQRINNAILADKCDELNKFEKDYIKKSEIAVDEKKMVELMLEKESDEYPKSWWKNLVWIYVKYLAQHKEEWIK